MAIEPKRVVLALVGFQVVDAIACAVPLQYIKDDLDHIRCPEPLQKALPVIKGASAVGLLGGLKMPRLGALTCAALMAYFMAAIGFHVRAGDRPLRSVPAASIGAWSAFVLFRIFRPAAASR